MPACDVLTIKKMAEDSGPWILVENKKRDLAWTSKCHNDTCLLCDTQSGKTVSIGKVINDNLFNINRKAIVKVVAKVETIS